MDGFPLLRPPVFLQTPQILISDSTGLATGSAPRRSSCCSSDSGQPTFLASSSLLWNQAKDKFSASGGLPWASGRGGRRGPGPPRQLASGAWGRQFFSFRLRIFHFRPLHFPDFRRQTRKFLLFRRRASSFPRLRTVSHATYTYSVAQPRDLRLHIHNHPCRQITTFLSSLRTGELAG